MSCVKHFLYILLPLILNLFSFFGFLISIFVPPYKDIHIYVYICINICFKVQCFRQNEKKMKNTNMNCKVFLEFNLLFCINNSLLACGLSNSMLIFRITSRLSNFSTSIVEIPCAQNSQHKFCKFRTLLRDWLGRWIACASVESMASNNTFSSAQNLISPTTVSRVCKCSKRVLRTKVDIFLFWNIWKVPVA
jgi:hypothetical protein